MLALEHPGTLNALAGVGQGFESLGADRSTTVLAAAEGTSVEARQSGFDLPENVFLVAYQAQGDVLLELATGEVGRVERHIRQPAARLAARFLQGFLAKLPHLSLHAILQSL